MYFFQLSWIGLFGANRAYLHLETPKLQENSFKKLTQLSQGSNVLNAPHSNTEGALLRDTCVSSTQVNRCIAVKRPTTTLKYLSCRNIFFLFFCNGNIFNIFFKFFKIYLFLFYSYVHSLFGSFLPHSPHPLSTPPHTLPYPPLPIATRQKLFCPYL
jgi:hypothetical protein